MMCDKLGLFGEEINDRSLVNELLNWMHKNKADYTNTFCFLMNEKFSFNEKYNNKDFLIWKQKWDIRLKLNNNTQDKYLRLMKSVNPLVIPRNHNVEQTLAAADSGDISLLHKIIEVLKKPYTNQKNILEFQSPNPKENKNYQTFCGT